MSRSLILTLSFSLSLPFIGVPPAQAAPAAAAHTPPIFASLFDYVEWQACEWYSQWRLLYESSDEVPPLEVYTNDIGFVAWVYDSIDKTHGMSFPTDIAEAYEMVRGHIAQAYNNALQFMFPPPPPYYDVCSGLRADLNNAEDALRLFLNKIGVRNARLYDINLLLDYYRPIRDIYGSDTEKYRYWDGLMKPLESERAQLMSLICLECEESMLQILTHDIAIARYNLAWNGCPDYGESPQPQPTGGPKLFRVVR